MPPTRRSDLSIIPIVLLLLLLPLLAGCLPPDEPQHPRPAPTVDPDLAQLAHTWKVAAHVLDTRTTLSDGDAAEHHGREVTVGGASYSTPWHGTCDEANRERHARGLTELATRLHLSAAAQTAVRDFVGDSLVEYKLSCRHARTPNLTIFVGAQKAMTCFGGACYLLAR